MHTLESRLGRLYDCNSDTNSRVKITIEINANSRTAIKSKSQHMGNFRL